MTAPSVSSVKVDSKGRIVLPPELRNEMELEPGDVLSLRKTKEGVLVSRARKTDYASRFRQLIESPPSRTGKPENWSPSKMKRVWKTA